MKKIVKLTIATMGLASALVGIAHAAKPGAYLGAGLGESMIQNENGTYHNHGDGLAGRAFAGYNFNEYLGMEAGVARYAQAKNSFQFGSVERNLATFDVVAKAYLPFPIQQACFNVYGLAGLAYAHENYEFKNINTVPSLTNVTAHNSNTTNRNSIHPIYGVGASYEIPQTNLVTNVEFTRLQGSTSVFGGKQIANANMMTLNLAYNFQ